MSEAMSMEAEFPFVAGMAKREKTRVQKIVDRFNEIKAISQKKGFLVPAGLAAKLLDVSRQRVNDLMREETLDRVDIDGHPFVTEESLVEFASSERKAGRPSKFVSACEKGVMPMVKEAARIGRSMAK